MCIDRGGSIIEWERDENGHIIDLYDLLHDDHKLFKVIIETAICRYSESDYTARKKRERELAEITAAQWEATSKSLPPTKATLFDLEVARIKNDFLWASIVPEDYVGIVYWQDEFAPLVSFARQSGRTSMRTLLDTTSDELKKSGFGPNFIARITHVMTEWAERLLNPDTSMIESDEQGRDADEDGYTDIVTDVLSFFFSAEGDSADE